MKSRSYLVPLNNLSTDNVSRYIRSLILLRSANNAVAFSLPVMAAVLSFVAYSLSGHPLEAAVIFTSLTLFQLLRLPLLFLRTSLILMIAHSYLNIFQRSLSVPLLMLRMLSHDFMMHSPQNCSPKRFLKLLNLKMQSRLPMRHSLGTLLPNK